MFNVAVLKMKDIIKFFVGVVIIILCIILLSKNISKKNIEKSKEKQIKIPNVKIVDCKGCLEKTLTVISSDNSENELENKIKENVTNNNYFEEILKTEISTIKGIENLENEDKMIEEQKENENEKYQNNEEKEEQVTTVENKEGIRTEIVTENPIAENYNVQFGKVKIKNQTTYALTDEILKPDIKIDNKNILIFHTHSCESYTSSEKYMYTPTGNYRTTDLNYSVTRVGTELEKYLKQYNINVVHDTTYHDYPSYNGSYTRSLDTVENILKTSPSDIIIDLHRDAIGSREDYAPTVKIGDDYAAQIMFVIRNK